MCLLIIDTILHYLGLYQQTDTLLPDRHLPDRLIDNILKKVSSCICPIKVCNFITSPPAPPHWQISTMLSWNLNQNISIITISLDNELNLDFVGVVILMLISPQKYRRSLLNQSTEAVFLKIQEIVLFFKPLPWKSELISPWLLRAVLQHSRDIGIVWCVTPRETCLLFFSNSTAVLLSMDPRKRWISCNLKHASWVPVNLWNYQRSFSWSQTEGPESVMSVISKLRAQCAVTADEHCRIREKLVSVCVLPSFLFPLSVLVMLSSIANKMMSKSYCLICCPYKSRRGVKRGRKADEGG